MTDAAPGVTTLNGDGARVADPEAVDVALAAGGDGGAFERLYRRHVARVHSLARRMMGGEAAEDVTQDVFVRAWAKLGTFRGDAAFGTWLHRLAVNVILTRRSARGIERGRYELGDAIDAVPTAAPEPHAAVDFEEGISRLPDGARQVFVLHDVAGYKHDEIAAMLGIVAGTSKSPLHQAVYRSISTTP